MTTYTCPQGHEITTDKPPICKTCKLVATGYNTRTGVVYKWTPAAQHRRNCEALEAAVDDAFDNQYFGGGW